MLSPSARIPWESFLSEGELGEYPQDMHHSKDSERTVPCRNKKRDLKKTKPRKGLVKRNYWGGIFVVRQ